MVGSAVAITVESRFCMNSALATIKAVRRVRLETLVEREESCAGMPSVSRRRGHRETPPRPQEQVRLNRNRLRFHNETITGLPEPKRSKETLCHARPTT